MDSIVTVAFSWDELFQMHINLSDLLFYLESFTLDGRDDIPVTTDIDMQALQELNARLSKYVNEED